MSHKRIVANVVVEWSPTHVSWIGPNHSLNTASSVLEAASQLPGRDVVIAVSRRTAFVRAYRVPNAGKPEVQRILSMQIGQLFPIPANELSFDFHLTHDVSSEGRLAIVAAMRSADLESMHEQAKAAGLRVVQVLPAALGSSMVAQSVNLSNAAVVHRTAEGLAVDLLVDGEIRYSRVAPMPANAIGIEAEVSRTFAAAVLSCSPTIAAGALALPDAEASTDTWALEALLGSNIDIDIQTPEQILAKEKKLQRQRGRLSTLLLAAAVLLFTGVYLGYEDQMKLVNRGKGFWSKNLRNVQKLHDAQIVKTNEAVGLKASLDRAFEPAQSFSDMLTAASNAAPPGVWLTGFSVERGKSLSIRGTAVKSEAVAQFERALIALAAQDASGDKKPRFRDVKLVFANNTEIENTPVVQFSISAFPVGNLPLIDPNTKKKPGVKK